MSDVKKPTKQELEHEYMTLNELCALLHICRNTGRKLLDMTDFPCVRIGKQFRIHREGLARWQEANKGKTVMYDEPAVVTVEY